MAAEGPTVKARNGEDELCRLAALSALEILDSPAEAEFDALVRLAKRLFGGKFAVFSLIDSTRQWSKASCGVDASQTPREHSFCSTAVENNEALVVADAAADPRFASNPFVTGPPFVRFYAGVPIRAKVDGDGTRMVPIGTICVVDDAPRHIDRDDLDRLEDLACLLEALIEARAVALRASRFALDCQSHAHLLDREQRHFRQAERMANMGAWRLTLADRKTEWSPQVFAIHELPVGDRPPLEDALSFYPPHARPIVSAAVAQTIETGQPYEIETDFITAQGSKRRVRSIGELEVQDGEPVALIGVFQDVTIRYELEQSLRRMANYDDLTQIPGRAMCNEVLDQRIARARELNQDLALLLIDLDGFKMVNDRCGHLVGDKLLRRVGAKLQAPYLSKCFVARLGGDEFVTIVSSLFDCANLDVLVERLLADLCVSVDYGGGSLKVSGTIGIGWLDDDVRDRAGLMHRADKALYAAKRERRGSVQTFAARPRRTNKGKLAAS